MIGTVMILPLGGIAWLTIQQSIQIKINDSDKIATQVFETKLDHAQDMNKLSQWTKSISDNQGDLKLAVQHINDTMQSK